MQCLLQTYQTRGYLAIYSESSVRVNIAESCLYQPLLIPTPPPQYIVLYYIYWSLNFTETYQVYFVS